MKSETGKSFDVMKWLRETRDRHYEETKDMTPEGAAAMAQEASNGSSSRGVLRPHQGGAARAGSPWGVRPFRD